MGWDEADKKAADTGGKFIKLKEDEQSVKGVLIGKPTCRDVIFDERTGKTREFTDDDEKAGKKAQTKFKFNIWTLEVDDKPVEKPDMRIIEVSAPTYRFIAKLRIKAGGELGWKVVYIVRNGKAKDTATTYMVSLSDNDLSEDLQIAAKEAKLHNLESGDSDDSDGDSSGGGGDFGSYENNKKESEDGPISKEQASQLAEPYKPPDGKLKGEITEFLTKFGVVKFASLKKSQFDDAMSYTRNRLNPPVSAEVAAEAENDPFA